METQEMKPPTKLYAALAKAQGEFAAIPKNRTVAINSAKGSYKFSYADLETIIAATRPALAKHGLSVIQPIIGRELKTILCHESGEAIESSMTLPDPIGASDPKYYGSIVTYFRRYAYQSLICVSADDDLDEDGAEAEQPKKPAQAERVSEKAAKPEYSPEKFKADFPLWEKPIKSGKKSADSVIAHIESKYAMTDDQKKAIKAIKAIKVEAQGEDQ